MQQIAEWLKQLGMSEYTERFAENNIDFAILGDLTDHLLALAERASDGTHREKDDGLLTDNCVAFVGRASDGGRVLSNYGANRGRGDNGSIANGRRFEAESVYRRDVGP